MIRQCFLTNTGIRFHAELLKNIGLDPSALHPIVKERPAPLQPDTPHFNTVAPPIPVVNEESGTAPPATYAHPLTPTFCILCN